MVKSKTIGLVQCTVQGWKNQTALELKHTIFFDKTPSDLIRN